MNIRLLAVDDSPIFLDCLDLTVAVDSGIEIVGTAKNGEEAVRMARELSPDVITMDIHMPVKNGLAATREIMEGDTPIPIVVVSSDHSETNVFDAIDLGAVDVIEKPHKKWDDQQCMEFCARLRRYARMQFVGTVQRRSLPPIAAKGPRVRRTLPVVGIVCSTGGPKALKPIINGLTGDLNACILIVQHMAKGFTEGLISWLKDFTSLSIREAVNGEPLARGTVLFAPDGRHMVADPNYTVRITNDTPYEGHCPSGTVLLDSIAHSYGSSGIGVVLSGIGNDGAKGALEIRKRGGHTICQDPSTIAAYGMPKAAVEIGAIMHQYAVEQIADAIKARVDALYMGAIA